LSFRVSDLFKTDRLLLNDFIHYSAPVVINETVWAIGSSFQSVIVGHISSDAVAANSIAGVVQRLAMVAIMGVANFTAIAVGKQIGLGNAKKANDYASTMLRISLALGVCASVMILLLRKPFLSLYNVSDITDRYAFEIMTVYALSTFFISFNYTNIIGVLRGGGDTKFAMTVDILTLWLIALPCGAVAGLIFKWPIPVVFLFLTADEPVKVLIGLPRFKSGKWLRNVTR
jgi:Na+-driven multidrug efflux pump